MVFCTGVSPVLFGWFIDINIQVKMLALASALFMLATSLLAFYAYRLKPGQIF
ncbi:MAG: hypothetical protein GY820_03895 [Gammaproteobacteria bacterium]|nr:hypothetical protein [Gammaproteobacteria bacterium]